MGSGRQKYGAAALTGFFHGIQWFAGCGDTGKQGGPKGLRYSFPATVPVAAALVVGLHKWRHNTPLSIVGGTAVYMLLV